ncbi:hypothetical protein HanOQP8_Chr11g0400311 [Helianthus annuus]|nr:hypothetical protein HanLR1_Chr11g0398131 [Helianthus annuus]KAJ0688970.1 hypothetical protein HanOQP8_Chr11g0400311 [Helianthus annuus]
MVLTLWWVREKKEQFDPYEVYGDSPNIFTIRINHGGVFVNSPVKRYVDGTIDHVDMVDSDAFSVIELNHMITELGYPKEQIMFYHFLVPETQISDGLRPLGNDQDVLLLIEHVAKFKVIDVFTEQWSSRLGVEYHFTSPVKSSSVVIEELENEDPQPSMSKPSHRRRRPLCLEYFPQFETPTVNADDTSRHEETSRHDESSMHDEPNRNDETCRTDDHSSAYVDTNRMDDHATAEEVEDDRIEDVDNTVVEIPVNMDSFNYNVGKDQFVDEDFDVDFDLDDFESGSEDEGGDALNLAIKQNRKRKKETKGKCLEEQPFFVGQTFSNKEDIKNMVKLHALRSKRQLVIRRNESYRFRVVCLGVNPVFVCGGSKGKKVNFGRAKKKQKKGKESSAAKEDKSSHVGGSTSTNKREKPTCPWALHISRKKNEQTWLVKTYHHEHKCLQTRKVRLYTVTSIAKEILPTIESNPSIPLKSLQDQIEKKNQV